MDNQICFCGRLGKISCSWIAANLGRRFVGCERYGKRGACGYFMWVDTPMCARARVVIPGLIRSIGRLEAQTKTNKKIKMVLFVAPISSWVFLDLCLSSNLKLCVFE
ncbi:hypothetical protein Vadar_021024 [Vaccinium darrowii]|uniref:Uncharacterized protein n=1 Tax=Vaccinium darrowii TaxID=229202 RepID=A0ACB7XS72_9ERIC|nr:hypothetical protein Vadar_021024 [Vaccinium darrowii]